MKITLIDPPLSTDSDGYNTGLAYLSAVLKNNNHEVKVIDLVNRKDNIENRINNAIKDNPDIVGISISCMNESNGIKILKQFKENTNAICIVGGGGATLNTRRILKTNNNIIDCLFIGESEETIIEFIEKKDDYHNIKGIAYYKNGKVFINERRSIIKNIDSIPIPDYTTFDSFNGEMTTAPILTSRGCPFSCVFCTNEYLWERGFRKHSVKRVIEEIKIAKKIYNAKRIYFYDNNFSTVIDRAKAICREMIKENLQIDFQMYNGMRADSIDDELLILMKEAGCSEISFGIENGDKETFPLVEKSTTLEKIENAVKLAKKYKIKCKAFMIVGLIGTTFESDKRSLKFVNKKLKIQSLWYIALPYPHTKLYNWVKQNGTILIHRYDNQKISPAYPPPIFFETSEYSKEDRQKMYELANLHSKNFYFLYNDIYASWMNKFIHIMKISWKIDKKNIIKYAFNYWYGLSIEFFKRHFK